MSLVFVWIPSRLELNLLKKKHKFIVLKHTNTVADDEWQPDQLRYGVGVGLLLLSPEVVGVLGDLPLYETSKQALVQFLGDFELISGRKSADNQVFLRPLVHVDVDVIHDQK